jgi:hypothetical protein
MDIGAVTVILSAVTTAVGFSSFFGYQYFKNLKLIDTKISDKEIVELAKQNNGILTPAILCEHTKLSLNEAKTKLYNLSLNGIITQKYDWNDWSGNKYVLAGYESQNNFFGLFEVAKPKPTPLLNKKEALSDALVIKYALEMKGKLSAPALCVKANCSIDEAKAKLDELQRKEVFELRVADNGTYVYELTDLYLLK